MNFSQTTALASDFGIRNPLTFTPATPAQLDTWLAQELVHDKPATLVSDLRFAPVIGYLRALNGQPIEKCMPISVMSDHMRLSHGDRGSLIISYEPREGIQLKGENRRAAVVSIDPKTSNPVVNKFDDAGWNRMVTGLHQEYCI